MPRKGPHISIASELLLSRVLNLSAGDVSSWPEDVRELAIELAEELFLIRYNPFIDPGQVYLSVTKRFREETPSLSSEYIKALDDGMGAYWSDYRADQAFKEQLLAKLARIMPEESISTKPNNLVEAATDATDLRMELPMAVVSPETTEQVRDIILLANKMGFSIVPRGGGSGLTGGAIPALRRTVILSLSKFKEILNVDVDEKVLCVQSGVITLDAIKAAAAKGMFFSVDPASKAASSIGGNISENSGGPCAFEYGTTIDNILSYRMVTATGEIIEVRRKDHPWSKILPDESPVFEIFKQESNGDFTLKDSVTLTGPQVRQEGLGKDVTNKFLGGLPGVQKEGVDGIITEGCFTLYPLQKHTRTLCLEFFGQSMHNAMLVIKDLIALRNTIREQGDLVKMAALEEFGVKYVQAIEYVKKSDKYEGMPISVLLVQLDSDDTEALEDAVAGIANICEPYDNVDVFIAKDQKEAEFFWEDRHKLSAISKRTSGFKINEDIVIPTDVIPEFSDFLEELNLKYLAKAYRVALHKVGQLPWIAADDEFIAMERDLTADILRGAVTTKDVPEQILETQVFYFFQDLRTRYPALTDELTLIFEAMQNTRIVIANHMHAGDGNCHVNIPVNSNDHKMVHNAENAAEEVFTKVLSLNGQITGEHGVGITKINFLEDEKIEALRAYKAEVDPKNIFNPTKLTTRELATRPYTFSFNRLIQDISKSGLPEKERLINLLSNIQTCTRCGKCKQVCPMFFPEQSLIYHPRNKNISLGALIEAIYYSQVNRGEPDPRLLDDLRALMEHCTACGKCAAVCPVKIDTPKVALHLRSFLHEKEAGGHPIKNRVLHFLAAAPAKRVPQAAKMAGYGQMVMNRVVSTLPPKWRARMQSPLFTGQGPVVGLKSLQEVLDLEQGAIFLPTSKQYGRREAVFYFPGCGGALFYHSIGMAGLAMLLDSGVGVVLPKEHLCCGYPLLAGGCEEAYSANEGRNKHAFRKLLDEAKAEGVTVTAMLTACGSCRDGLERYELGELTGKLEAKDVVQYIIEHGAGALPAGKEKLLYHASCHAEWTGVAPSKAPEMYRSALQKLTGGDVQLSPRCCGESGMGALSSPEIYNKLRQRKQDQLKQDLVEYDTDAPVLVGCPSCKVGISRSMMAMKKPQEVLHTLEYLAQTKIGADWQEKLIKEALDSVQQDSPVRLMKV